MSEQPKHEPTTPVADFGRQGDPSVVIPAEAYLGGWNVQVRALEAEVCRLRAALTATADRDLIEGPDGILYPADPAT